MPAMIEIVAYIGLMVLAFFAGRWSDAIVKTPHMKALYAELRRITEERDRLWVKAHSKAEEEFLSDKVAMKS